MPVIAAVTLLVDVEELLTFAANEPRATIEGPVFCVLNANT